MKNTIFGFVAGISTTVALVGDSLLVPLLAGLVAAKQKNKKAPTSKLNEA